MGEAKRKAAAGRKQRPQVGRGILLPSLLEQSGPDGVSTRQMSDETFSSAILYFDKFSCPTNNLIHVALRDEELLIREGTLIRPTATFFGAISSGQIAGFAAHAQSEMFRQLEKENPGFWVFGEAEPDELAKTDQFVPARTALIELIGALPLPPSQTSVESMLEFKRLRLPELQQLRHSLDEMYLRILDSGDPQIATQYCVTEIDKSLADVTRVTKEWWKFVKISDLKSLVAVGGGIAGAALGYAVQLPTMSAIVGGAGTMVGIAQGVQAKLRSDRKLPFWYASQVSHKLI